MLKVAYHPNLSAELLPRLAQSPNPYVLEGVAANPQTPGVVLEEIFDKHDRFSRDYRIKNGLSQNASAPEPVIRSLAINARSDDQTLMNIYRNSSTPSDIKEHVKKRIDMCEFVDIDYPFTPCVPNSTNWETIENSVPNRAV